MKDILLIFSLMVLCINALPQNTDVIDTILWNGDVNKRINLVFLGDGYQADEMDDYHADVITQTQALFATPPFDSYRNYFNVFSISIPSEDSGASHPGTASDEAFQDHPVELHETTYKCTFDYFGVHRLLSHTNNNAFYHLLQHFPQYDQSIMISNTPYYGGSGGYIPVGSRHENSTEIVIHELAHSFANLADEYWADAQYVGEHPNMTSESDSTLVRWKDWVGEFGVGVYEHCCGGEGWYRPHEICKMRFLNAPFCAVCMEAIVNNILDLINPIESFSPSYTNVTFSDVETFKLDLLCPTPNTLKIDWRLNGELIAQNVDSVILGPNYLNKGLNTLVAEVLDTTYMVRSEDHPENHLDVIAWNIYFKGTHLISAFLEGAYDGNEAMRNDLLKNNLLPLQQPYNIEPFSYNGNEAVENYDAFSPNTVDWILAELRIDSGKTILEQKAGLLMKNGGITHPDGSTLVFDNLSNNTDYYIAIRHRNHLGIMTGEPIDLVSSKNDSINFIDPNTLTYGNLAQTNKLDQMMLWSGRTNESNQVIFQGANNNPNNIFFKVLTDSLNQSLQINYVDEGYECEDVNMDGQTIYQGSNNDPNNIFFNVISHPANTNNNLNFIIIEQLPIVND